jgi:hypothetical protein
MMNAFPYTYYNTRYVDNVGHVTEPAGCYSGMTLAQFYLAHILTGLAANPSTMLNVEDHIDYAIRMAKMAAEKSV